MRFRVLIPIALALALATTAATTFVNRPYPAGLTGESGCATDENNPYGLCRDMRPQGGFPLIHISDKREGAEPGKLGLDDDIYPVSIAGNVAGYMAVWLALIGAISLITGRRRPAAEPEPNEEAPAEEASPTPAAAGQAVDSPSEAPAAKPENAPPS